MTKRKKKQPLSRKRTQRDLIVGVSWYTPEQFVRMKSVADDSDSLDDTYNDWLKNATNTVQTLKQRGLRVVKVQLIVDEWLAWCQENGKVLNGAARSEYTSWKTSQRSKASSPPGQFVSRHIKPRRNPIPLLDRLEALFEEKRDKSVIPPYPFDKAHNTMYLPKEVEDQLRQLIRTGNKIEAVKLVTKLTGAGLRVAKDYVDSLSS